MDSWPGLINMARRHKRLPRASKAQPIVVLRFTAAGRREIGHKSVLEHEWNWDGKSTLFCAMTVNLAAVVTHMQEAVRPGQPPAACQQRRARLARTRHTLARSRATREYPHRRGIRRR